MPALSRRGAFRGAGAARAHRARVTRLLRAWAGAGGRRAGSRPLRRAPLLAAPCRVRRFGSASLRRAAGGTVSARGRWRGGAASAVAARSGRLLLASVLRGGVASGRRVWASRSALAPGLRGASWPESIGRRVAAPDRPLRFVDVSPARRARPRRVPSLARPRSTPERAGPSAPPAGRRARAACGRGGGAPLAASSWHDGRATSVSSSSNRGDERRLPPERRSFSFVVSTASAADALHLRPAIAPPSARCSAALRRTAAGVDFLMPLTEPLPPEIYKTVAGRVLLVFTSDYFVLAVRRPPRRRPPGSSSPRAPPIVRCGRRRAARSFARVASRSASRRHSASSR